MSLQQDALQVDASRAGDPSFADEDGVSPVIVPPLDQAALFETALRDFITMEMK